MNIHQSFLNSFIGGVFYFRFPCFETGPEFWYLFRSRIIDLESNQEGFFVAAECIMPNRFSLGEWISHEIDSDPVQAFKTGANPLFGSYPRFCLITPQILHVKTDSVGEGILYSNDSVAPGDPLEVFRDFPEGYEAFAGLGSL